MTSSTGYCLRWTVLAVLLSLTLQPIFSQSAAGKDVVVLAFDDNVKYQFNEGLCALQRDQKWGFIDTTGKVVIDFRFITNGSEIPAFHEGKCCVSVPSETDGLKWVYIDKTGKTLFPGCKFARITSFSGGMALVEKSDMSNETMLCFIDSLGRTISGAVTPCYASGMKLKFSGFREGLAAVCDSKTKGWGYIDRRGRWSIMPKSIYLSATNFHEGIAFVQESSEGKWGAINKDGDLVIPFMYLHQPADFSNGLSAVRDEADRIGYINQNGDMVIPYRYEPIQNHNGLPFFEGNAIVLKDGTYYSISTSGKENLKIGDASADVSMLQNGLVVFKKWLKSEIWAIGLMRTNGEVIHQPDAMIQIGEFSNGLAFAKAKNGSFTYNGFVNLDTNFVILNENQ